jgi:hypothetical protein
MYNLLPCLVGKHQAASPLNVDSIHLLLYSFPGHLQEVRRHASANAIADQTLNLKTLHLQELPPSVQTSSRSGAGKAELMALISQLRAAFAAERQASDAGGLGSTRLRRAGAAEAAEAAERGDAREDSVKTVVVEQRWEGADDPWPELRQQEAAQPDAAQH